MGNNVNVSGKLISYKHIITKYMSASARIRSLYLAVNLRRGFFSGNFRVLNTGR
jgi:hypothetical protein